MVGDIPVGDTELGEEEEEIEALAFGVELNPDEEAYMKLPNSVTDFTEIDVEKIQTSIQATAAKLRMSVREQEDHSPQGLEIQDAEALMASRRVYDSQKKVADFRKREVTDSSLNKRITVPEAAPAEKEIKILALVDTLEQIVKDGKKVPASPRAGRPKPPVLSEQEQRGRESILSREKIGEIVILETDKSGRRAAVTPELYTNL